MTTTSTKGRITGLLALTFATDVALAEGDFVMLVGPYKVGLADGSKRCVGTVTVRSVKRVIDNVSSTFPVATTTGGQVTADVRGYMVVTRLAGAAIAAGADVGINSTGAIVVFPAGSTTISRVGTALTTTNAAGQEIDVLLD
jgi:hypothetical protein